MELKRQTLNTMSIIKKIKDVVSKPKKAALQSGESQKQTPAPSQADALKQTGDAPIVARVVKPGPRKTFADLMAEANERAKANKERIEAIKKQRNEQEG